MGMNAERDAMAEAVGDALLPHLVELFQAERDANRAAMVTAAEEGFARAFATALTEENARRVFKVGVDVLKEESKRAAGDVVIGGIGKLFRLAFWPVFLLLAAWLIGGPGLFKTMWNALVARGG